MFRNRLNMVLTVYEAVSSKYTGSVSAHITQEAALEVGRMQGGWRAAFPRNLLGMELSLLCIFKKHDLDFQNLILKMVYMSSFLGIGQVEFMTFRHL